MDNKGKIKKLKEALPNLKDLYSLRPKSEESLYTFEKEPISNIPFLTFLVEDDVTEEDIINFKHTPAPLDGLDLESSNYLQLFIKEIKSLKTIKSDSFYILETFESSIIGTIEPAKHPDKIRCIPLDPSIDPVEVYIQDISFIYEIVHYKQP